MYLSAACAIAVKGEFTIHSYQTWSSNPSDVLQGKKGRLPTLKLEIHKVLLSKQTTNKNSTKQYSRKRYQNNALGDVEETAVCQILGRIPVGETNGQGFIIWRKNMSEMTDIWKGGRAEAGCRDSAKNKTGLSAGGVPAARWYSGGRLLSWRGFFLLPQSSFRLSNIVF